MPDWITFFAETIGALHEPLAVVLQASGCREGWLQGELFRAGRPYDLRVNEYRLGSRQTADLSCGDAPEMLAELKIVGANYFPKMESDRLCPLETLLQPVSDRLEEILRTTRIRDLIAIYPPKTCCSPSETEANQTKHGRAPLADRGGSL